MSARPGTPQSIIGPTVALGAAGGVNVALGPSAQVLQAVSIVYTASGTAGNRAVVIRALNAAGSILWSAAFATAVTATQVSRLQAGAGVPATSVTTPLQQTYPLPDQLSLEAGSSIQVLDAANVDTADTVQVNVLVTF